MKRTASKKSAGNGRARKKTSAVVRINFRKPKKISKSRTPVTALSIALNQLDLKTPWVIRLLLVIGILLLSMLMI